MIFAGLLILTGCATMEDGVYRPKSSKEKAAFSKAVKDVSPADVRQNFRALESTEMAWAGVIKDIQFKETERTIQVAFQIDHRSFDWTDHGGDKPYRLSSTGDGVFVAGWIVRKPTTIGKLKTEAKAGYMMLVYGKPYQMKEGVIQVSTSALRLIKTNDYEVMDVAVEEDELSEE